LIDIRYWHYQENGTAYEPKGGQNLAPRQHARLLKPKRTSFEQVYRAVSEYRQKHPTKAVTYSGDNYDQFGWAVLMAGGSMPVLPPLDKNFLAAVSTMKPVYNNDAKGQWVMKSADGCIVYTNNKEAIQLPVSAGKYRLRYLSPQTGSVLGEETIEGGQTPSIKPQHSPAVLWVSSIQNSVRNETSIQK
jgi:hypothetical protein